MRNTSLIVRTMAVVLTLLAVLSAQGAWAAPPDLRLPGEPVTASYVANEADPDYKSGSKAFFDTTLSNVPAGFDVTNGAYDGWCAEPDSGPDPAGGTFDNVVLYSSYDPNLPDDLKLINGNSIPWGKVNWVLNNKGGNTGHTIQLAIWSLIVGDPLRFGCVAGTPCGNLVQNADAGFVPDQPGQVVAVIATNGTGINGTNDHWQENIIEVPLGKLGDFVWDDLNADGIQDAGEPGIPDVNVNLLDPGPDNTCNTGDEIFLESTTTGVDGYYSFVVGTPKDYCVQFEPPDGYVFSPPKQGDGTDDSKVDPNTGQTIDPAFVPKGGENLNQDAGLYKPSLFTLGDRVWYDQDQDGIQDANEPGYNGIAVDLHNNATCSGTPIAGTTTGAAGPAGFYQFTDLAPGDYCVQFGNVPAGWSISPPNQGDGTNDSKANGSAQIPNISLTADDPHEDMGIYVPGTLGDDVRCVSTGDPLANITVSLFKDFDGDGVADGPAIATTQSDTNGFYQFTGLEVALAGDPVNLTRYIVQVDVNDADLGACNVPVPPTEYNPPLDSNNPNNPNNDFQFQLPARYTLGDRVWYDQDQDGIQDANEPGYNGATVQLFSNASCTGAPTATTTTAAGPTGFGDGYYQFTNLLAGDYCVQFGNVPAGWSISPADQGDGTNDSSANSSARIPNISLTADDPHEDMGIYVPGTLGDNVMCISTGEGLANIGVSLSQDFDCNGTADGTAVATTQTDTTGFYQFTGLEVALAGDPVNQTCYIVEVDATDPDLGTCSVPIPPTAYNPPLDSNNPNDPNNDFQFQEPLVCDLVVDKTCQLPPAPVTPFVCSDAKPIDSLSMIWNGTETVDIVAWKGSVGSTVVGTVQNVAPGDLVTISGFAGSPNDVYWEIFDSATGTKLGESTFHLSCSDDDMNGPEDCGKPQGDGKGKTGFLNDWLFEGMAGNGLILDCSPEPPAPSDTCEFTLGPNPSCATLGKPTSLTFQYTGGGCTASDNTQDPSKATCTGGIDPSLPVLVTTSNSGYTLSPSNVDPGGEFTVSASSFNADSFFTLSNAGGTESLKIHTSCSQPLEVGDVFGSLTLVAFNGQQAGNEVTYSYQVTNLGDPLSNVLVTDIPLGDIAGPFPLATGETQTFSKVVDIFETTTNTALVTGLLADGSVCPAPSDKVTVTVTEPCDVCKGGTTLLSLRYLGSAAAQVVVYDDPGAKVDKILFQGTLQPGQEITITPRPGQSKLNNDVSIYVNGVLNAKIKTDCSQPIGPGLISGDFEIVEGRSKDNGLMCPLNTCDPAAAPALEFSGKEVRWYVTNNGDLGLEIERISITWPTANGYLDEIKREGDVIHKGNFNPPSAVIDSGWESTPDKRTIKPGDTNVLKFKFQNDVTLAGGYSIVVEFTYGCSVEVGYTATGNGQPDPVCTGTNVTFQPASEGNDTYILFEKKDDNFGNADILMTDSEEAAKGPIRSLIQFDLSALSGKTINSARLSLYLFNNDGSQTDVVEAHRLTRDWVEGKATWNRYDGTNTWSNPGGDYDASVAGSFVASGTGWKTADLTSLTQAWASNVNPNYGVILLSPPAAGNNAKSYYSGDHTDPTLRPKLVVCYQ